MKKIKEKRSPKETALAIEKAVKEIEGKLKEDRPNQLVYSKKLRVLKSRLDTLRKKENRSRPKLDFGLDKEAVKEEIQTFRLGEKQRKVELLNIILSGVALKFRVSKRQLELVGKWDKGKDSFLNS